MGRKVALRRQLAIPRLNPDGNFFRYQLRDL
jgi:hypothetical protein